MTEEEAQHMMEGFSTIVSERLKATLPKGFRLVYEESPGEANSVLTVGNSQIVLNKLQQVHVPIANIEHESTRLRLTEAVDTLVDAISHDIKGKALLVTRPLAFVNDPPARVVYVKDFGMRIVVKYNLQTKDRHDVYVECLYGVA
jgi:hypothetical protein